MVHQYMPKILHDPHKNPPATPPTYLMYGPYVTTKGIPTLFLYVPLVLKSSFCSCLSQDLFHKTSSSDFLNAFVICGRQNINILFGVLDYKHSILSCDLDDKSHIKGIGDNQLLYNRGLSQIHLFSFPQ